MKMPCDQHADCLVTSPLSNYSAEIPDRKWTCDQNVKCVDRGPLENYSSEDPDRLFFLGRGYPNGDYRLGGDSCLQECGPTFSSGFMHQEDADLCAARQNIICNDGACVGVEIHDSCEVCKPPDDRSGIGLVSFDLGGGVVGTGPCCDPATIIGPAPPECCCRSVPTDPDRPPPPGTGPHTFSNTPQTCTVTCPDGSFYSFTIRAGLYVADSQILSDRMAYSAACRAAFQTMICIEDFSATICVNEPYDDQLSAVCRTGGCVFSIVAGSLPPGLSMDSTGFILGIPTQVGPYTFRVRVTGNGGVVAEKDMSITVVGAVGPLPNGAVCTGGYNAQVSFYPPDATITASGLPDGLFMNATGLITGTPYQGPGTYDVSVTVSGLGAVCTNKIPLTITSIVGANAIIDLTWTGVPGGIGGSQSMSGGSGALIATGAYQPACSGWQAGSITSQSSNFRNCTPNNYTATVAIHWTLPKTPCGVFPLQKFPYGTFRVWFNGIPGPVQNVGNLGLDYVNEAGDYSATAVILAGSAGNNFFLEDQVNGGGILTLNVTITPLVPPP